MYYSATRPWHSSNTSSSGASVSYLGPRRTFDTSRPRTYAYIGAGAAPRSQGDGLHLVVGDDEEDDDEDDCLPGDFVLNRAKAKKSRPIAIPSRPSVAPRVAAPTSPVPRPITPLSRRGPSPAFSEVTLQQAEAAAELHPPVTTRSRRTRRRQAPLEPDSAPESPAAIASDEDRNESLQAPDSVLAVEGAREDDAELRVEAEEQIEEVVNPTREDEAGEEEEGAAALVEEQEQAQEVDAEADVDEMNADTHTAAEEQPSEPLFGEDDAKRVAAALVDELRATVDELSGRVVQLQEGRETLEEEVQRLRATCDDLSERLEDQAARFSHQLAMMADKQGVMEQRLAEIPPKRKRAPRKSAATTAADGLAGTGAMQFQMVASDEEAAGATTGKDR